ncbi:ribosomal RNA small subunit methyltransferase A, partial [Mycoplasmopsis arginini]|uniref:ribosomal RNA small subunit methyltransferase A n=1 Tax=Mycoplasmopsis arginini TaxID=2094 RepID=UPI00249F4225
AEVHPGDCVFEVGAGMGSLTLGLLNAGARVIAAEVDYRLAKRLHKTVGEMPASEQLAQNLCILEQNALTVFQQEFLNAGVRAPNKMVSNLPYNIAVPVIFHTLWNFPSIKTLFVMVQKEIGDRLCQRVDVNGVNKSAVGQKIAYFGCAKLEGDVSREVFWPKPGV